MNEDTGKVMSLTDQEAISRINAGEPLVKLYDQAGVLAAALAASADGTVTVPGDSRARRRANARRMYGCSIFQARRKGWVPNA